MDLQHDTAKAWQHKLLGQLDNSFGSAGLWCRPGVLGVDFLIPL